MTIIPLKYDYLTTNLSCDEIINILNKYINQTSKEYSDNYNRKYVISIRKNKIIFKVKRPIVDSFGRFIFNQRMILKLYSKSQQTNIRITTRFSFFSNFLTILVLFVLGYSSVISFSEYKDSRFLIPFGFFVMVFGGTILGIYSHSKYVIKDFSQILKWIKITKHNWQHAI